MTLHDFDCVHTLTVDLFETFLALGHGERTKEIAYSINRSVSSIQRRIAKIRVRLNLDSIERTRMFAARFVAFTETERFLFCPDGQPEFEFQK